MRAEMPEHAFGLSTPDGRQPAVAVIDGNAATAMVATTLCEQFGCAVYRAATAEAALALLKREAAIDLVVMDLAIPDMDPIVAAQLIRALGRRGGMPIVAVAGSAAETASSRGRAVGFARTVVKPYSPRELYAALESSLTRTGLPAVPQEV
jgi:CheY-like chemotaxis protein